VRLVQEGGDERRQLLMEKTTWCPQCQTAMQKEVDPDITTDVCPSCGGVWLDKNELNALASGMAGDIEYCSIDEKAHEDKYVVRRCPKCAGRDLRKINLLRYSDVIFDFCPECEGFFLDKGEARDMNIYLAGLAEEGLPEEFRGHVSGRLVTSKRIEYSTLASPYWVGSAMGAQRVADLRLSAYFHKPLGLGLRVYSSKWGERLLKRLGLFREQDVGTGQDEFDRAFIVQGDNEARIRALMSKPELREELLRFVEDKPSVFVRTGSLEMTDARIIYCEGPYSGEFRYDVQADPSGMVARLVRMADLIEGS
jgi:Zn-finger nucleic acid-binding protein